MQVRVKYRIHGIQEQPLAVGSIVELDDTVAQSLIALGSAETLEPSFPVPFVEPGESEMQARCTELEAAFKAEREHSLALEQEVFKLRDTAANCEKELAKAQKNAKASKNTVPDEEKA